jgi:hypothetical protein
MKKFKYAEISDEYTAYNDVDIATFGDIIKQASEMWKEKTLEYYHKNGDVGTCVLGACIEVYYLGKRCRIPTTRCIIGTPDVAQGSITWEHSVDEVIKYLKENGVEARYNCGFMD